jgi:transglutaminase-like putative cysteine protease
VATATAAPRLPAPAAPARVATPVRPGLIRLATFTLLGAFTASAWGTNLLEPSGSGRAALMALIAAAMGAVMLWLADMPSPWLRNGGCAAALLVAIGLMLEAAGVGARLLVPDAWGELVSGISQGIDSLPDTTVPYQGLDPWVRTTILSGAGALLIIAAALAFWPRATPARPTAAAVALGVIYGVPAVERNFAHPFFSGAVLAILLTAFLWGERLERRHASIAMALGAVALVAGLLIAPRVDGARPLLDPQHLADPLTAKGDVFTWTHSYGPLNWPRDGHEVLRVKAQTPTYWKTVNLAQFDGIRWREDAVIDPYQPDVPESISGFPQWKQTITVVLRDLRSFQYVAAGTALDISRTHKLHTRDAPGTFVTGHTPLRPGDSYRATVYTPRPSQAQMAAAGSNYPTSLENDLSMLLPASVGGPPVHNPFSGRVSSRYATQIYFRTYDENAAVLSQPPNGDANPNGAALLRASRYGRAYALAQRLKAQSTSPYDFIQRVQREVRRNARYTESPPLTKIPLDTFLFGDPKLGYCQQFSGAMALLLRMGGVPARVASGFAPGSYDKKRREYVVRDLDAHSWVEAYFPGYGWVPFDPTPSVAPASSRASDTAASAAQGDINNKGGIGDRGSDPHQGGASGSGGTPVKLPVIIFLALLLALTVVRHERRQRRVPPGVDPELHELVRALRRSGRMPANGVTLRRLETVLGGSDAAQGYLQAIREHRYGDEDASPPTREQRRALRRVLGAGLGPLGTLRGWWALPPRVLHSKAWPTSTSSSATGRAFWSRATSTLQRSR